MLVQKAERMRESGEAVPENMFVVGEILRRNRPVLGVRR
jgi:hypothetical protein